MKQLLSLFSIYIMFFLFGMVVIRIALLQLGQSYITNLLYQLTNRAWKGVLLGTFATAILQSSSAVLVIVIALVSSQLLTFRHSIGIILGANVGTTVTTEILAFNISFFIIPFLMIGLCCLLFRRTLLYIIGCLCLGLASIFLAMNGFQTLAQPLTTIHVFAHFIELTELYPFIGIFVGTLLTAIIQSSTATIAISMGFIGDESLSLLTGIAIMLGANIGTCVTAFLASIRAGVSARLVAYANIWVNLIGVCLFIPFIHTFTQFIVSLTSDDMLQLAHASFFFNFICSLLFYPFITPFAHFIEKLYTKQT